MKQLTGLDASFLYMESKTNFGHVNGLGIYERPSPEFDPYRAVLERYRRNIGHLEPMQRRLVEVPFGLDHPYWIKDPDFDLEYHIRHIGLAPPGAADQLGEQVSRIVGRPMDRSRPLWEVYVIEGLADGRWALLSKTHHATVDGASGVILMQMIADHDEELEPIEWHGEPVPSDAELLQRTAMHLMTNPVKGARLQLRLLRSIADTAGITSVSAAASKARETLKTMAQGAEPADDEHERRVRVPISPAPPTPWNKSITAQRRFAMRSASLANIKALKAATGCTVNDIVMAICAGALREYLLKHDALPDEPLRAMVPVSIRTGNEEDPWTNRVSAIVADLPTDCADPIERVQRSHEAMLVAKEQFDLIPADVLVDAAEFASPIVATAAVRLSSRVANRVNLPANVVISNVPGPRQPLYFAGAKLDNYIPVSTITDNMGLNITVHSDLDRLDFGLIAARDLVPDLWDMADMHIDEVKRLFEATGADWAEPQPPASLRVGDAHTAPKSGKQATKQAAKKSGTKAAGKKRGAKSAPAKSS